jgi:hypothetical protein
MLPFQTCYVVPYFIIDDRVYVDDGITEDGVFQGVAVAFRGTESGTDALVDLMIMKSDVEPEFAACEDVAIHAGFEMALNAVWTPLLAHLGTARAFDAQELVITGHSLGAAVATICASRVDAMTTRSLLFTFGSPRVGNKAFAAYFAPTFSERCFRMRNDNDLVTCGGFFDCSRDCRGSVAQAPLFFFAHFQSSPSQFFPQCPSWATTMWAARCWLRKRATWSSARRRDRS